MTFTTRHLLPYLILLLLLAAGADRPNLPTFELHVVQRGGSVLSCGGSIRSSPRQISSFTTMNKGSNSYPLIPGQPSYMKLMDKGTGSDTRHTNRNLSYYHHVLFPSADECINFVLEQYTLKNSHHNRIIRMSPHSPPLMQMFVRQEASESVDEVPRASPSTCTRRKEAARAALESLHTGALSTWRNMSSSLVFHSSSSRVVQTFLLSSRFSAQPSLSLVLCSSTWRTDRWMPSLLFADKRRRPRRSCRLDSGHGRVILTTVVSWCFGGVLFLLLFAGVVVRTCSRICLSAWLVQCACRSYFLASALDWWRSASWRTNQSSTPSTNDKFLLPLLCCHRRRRTKSESERVKRVNFCGHACVWIHSCVHVKNRNFI